MKKLLLITCSLLLVLCMLASTGCDIGDDESDTTTVAPSSTPLITPQTGPTETAVHIHSYGEWTQTAKSFCTEPGSKYRVCECGDKQKEPIAPLGHKLADGVCTRCQASASQGLTFSLASTNDAYMVSGIGTCSDSVLIIPSVYEGLPVTTIDRSAFEECKTIKGVELSNSIKDIKGNAFKLCTNLEYIVLPNGLETIAGFTFYECSKLKQITIPETLTKITQSMFSGCSALESVNICSGINYIAQEAFTGCVSLKNITIPDSVPEIGNSVFAGCQELESVNFGNGVTKIDYSAFYGCVNLKKIDIPNATEIANDAFSGCKSLTTAIIGSSVPESGKKAGVLGKRVFAYCDKLETLVIGNGINTIDEETARQCKSLKTLTIGNSVKAIGKSAFSGCDSLETVTVGKNLQSIHPLGFSGATENIKEIHITDINKWCAIKYNEDDDDSDDIYLNGVPVSNDTKYSRLHTLNKCTLYYNGEPVKNIKITAVRINDHAFYRCATLESITLSKKVKYIDDYAFEQCFDLKVIIYEGTIAEWEAIEKGSGWHSGVSSCTVYCTDGNTNLK